MVPKGRRPFLYEQGVKSLHVSMGLLCSSECTCFRVNTRIRSGKPQKRCLQAWRTLTSSTGRIEVSSLTEARPCKKLPHDGREEAGLKDGHINNAAHPMFGAVDGAGRLFKTI